MTFPFIDQAIALRIPVSGIGECFYEKVIKVKADVAAVP